MILQEKFAYLKSFCTATTTKCQKKGNKFISLQYSLNKCFFNQELSLTKNREYSNCRKFKENLLVTAFITTTTKPIFRKIALPILVCVCLNRGKKKNNDNDYSNQERIKGTEKACPIHTLFHR